MRAVLDTNVLISGAFFSGTPSRILDACMAGAFQLLVSPEILDEYRRVGEEFTGRQPNLDFERLLARLVARSAVVVPRILDPGVCRDPDDDKFIACALQGRAGAIVSGDKDLLSVPLDMGVECMTPRQFLDRYIEPF